MGHGPRGDNDGMGHYETPSWENRELVKQTVLSEPGRDRDPGSATTMSMPMRGMLG